MEKENMIPVEDFCLHYGIDLVLIRSLYEARVFEVIDLEGAQYIDTQHLPEVEKFARMHTELGINAAGIETIAHILSRITAMQAEIKTLSHRIQLYESNAFLSNTPSQ
jgi:hypothetical protein